MRLSRFGIARQLVFGFSAVTVVLIAVLLVSLSGYASADSSRSKIESAAEAQSLGGKVKFQAANLNGWQTAYAFDINRGAPNATSDTGDSR